jgi:hypothetical protein
LERRSNVTKKNDGQLSTILDTIHEVVRRSSSINAALSKLNKRHRTNTGSFRDENRCLIQASVEITETLLGSRNKRRVFLKALKKDFKKFGSFEKLSPLVLGRIYAVNGRLQMTRINRYARGILELRERGYASENIAAGLKSEGGVEQLSSAWGLRQRGNKPPVKKRPLVRIVFGKVSKSIELERLAEAVNPDTNRGKILVNFDLDEAGNVVRFGKPKVRAVHTHAPTN